MDATLTDWLMRDVFGEVPSPFPEPPSWYRRAACWGPEVDFVDPGSRDALSACLDVCEAAPCGKPCAAYAACEGFTFGTWGGHSEKARQQARKDDRAA